MMLVVIIDALVVALTVGTVLRKGFESSLPVAAFLLMLFPNECQIPIPGVFEITTQRIVVVTLIALFAIFGRKNKQPLPLKYLLLLQIAWMLLSTIRSVVFTISLKTVLSQLFDYFVPFYIFSRSLTRVRTINKTLAAFVAAMAVCCIFGTSESYGFGSIISIFPPAVHSFADRRFEADRGIRAMSTFGHPILFGAALSLAIPLALYLLAETKRTSHKVLLWITVMAMFLNVYKTGSRGAWIATVLSVGLLLVFGLRKFRKYIGVIVLLSVVVLVVRPGVWETINNNYVATLDSGSPQGSSYEWRYALYGLAVRELAKDPGRALWGYGPESFLHLNLTGEFQGRIVPFDSCDSAVAQIMIETGYIGLVITVLLFFQGLSVSFATFRRMPQPINLLPLVLFTCLVAFSFLMTNVALFGWGQQTYMFWILLSVTMVYPRLATEQHIAARSEVLSLIPVYE